MKSVTLIAASICLMALAACGHKSPDVVYLEDYLTRYADGHDATLAIRMALDECRRSHASRLVMPADTLHLYPDLASEKYTYVTNNDAGLRRHAFDLSHLDDFTIDGGGAFLKLHGYISAFTIDSCTDITVQNLSIDYARTFHSEGAIVRAGDGWADLRFPKDYILRLSDGTLHFYDSLGNKYPFSNLLEFNAERKEPEFMASDYWLSNGTIRAELQPDSTVRIFKEKLSAKPGNVMVLGASHRKHPAFAINESKGVTLRNINIYHAGGMGVVAQQSSDILLDSINILPAPGSGRMVSVSADATHFTHCEGFLKILNCNFFNQKDDATNIHGFYGRIEKIVAPDTIRVSWPSENSHGLDPLRAGRDAEILTQKDLITYDTVRINSVRRLNEKWSEVALSSPLPANAAEGDLIAEIGNPEVLIKGCRFGNNRARGLLLGSRGKTVVEDCYFHIPGAAIYFEGDGSYWYERSGVRDVTIRNNHFDNCNYGYRVWGSACIATGGGPRESRKESRYNRNILIEGNTFTVSDPRILNLYSTDSVVFRNNRIIKSDAYDYILPETRAFVTDDCLNITIDNPETQP